MIGRKNTDSVSVKDVPAHAFIAAYATYLKKANKLNLPKVAGPKLTLEPRFHQDWSPQAVGS